MTTQFSGLRITVIVSIMLLVMAAGAFVVSRLPRQDASRPDLVLVVLDTVRYDRTSLGRGDGATGVETTPFLRGLAERGVTFSRARSTSEWTVPAHASILSGLAPSRHSAHFEHRYLADEVVTIAESLQARGYVTAGFSANPNIGRAFHFDQGFDHFFEAFSSSAQLGNASRSEAILAALEEWLVDNGRGPRFVFVNLMDAHLPYAAAREHLSTMAPRGGALDEAELSGSSFLDRVVAGERELDPDFVAALSERYDAALRTVDDRLRDLVELLERKRVLGPDALLVVTSDHGEHLGENGLVDHQGALSEALLRVPLVFVGRGAQPGVVNDAPISTDAIARHLSGAVIDGFRPAEVKSIEPLVAERFPAHPIVERIRTRFPQADVSMFEQREWAIVDPSAAFKLCVTDDGNERWFRLEPTGIGETLLTPEAEPSLREVLRGQLARYRERARPITERFTPDRNRGDDLAGEENLAALAQSGYAAAAMKGATSIHAQVHLERGNRAFAAGDFESARREYLGSSELDPRFPAARFNLAVVAERLALPVQEQIDAWERYLAVAVKSSLEEREKLEQAYGRLEALRASSSR